MGCWLGKHKWQITHSNDTYPFRCIKCGKRSTGVKTHRPNTGKKIAIISVVLSVIVLYVLVNGVPQFPQISIPNFIETKPTPTPSETTQGQSSPPTTSNNQVVLSNCIMASNGAGGIRVNCAGHDSVQCISDPPIGSGIQKDVTLTIDQNSCIVQYPNPQGSNTIYHFQLGSSPTTNTGTNPPTPLPTITIPKVTFPKITLPKVTIPTIQVPETPTPLDSKPIINIPVLETKIHDLINVQRTQNSLTALSLDPQLNLIARAHSQDMATRNYFEHDTPEGADPTARALSAGYHCHKDLPNGYYMDGLAENIYQNNLYNSYQTIEGVIVSHDWNDMDALASSTVQGWMHSTGHRENILTSTFDREGIGVAISSDDKVYITEDFC
jgi:uncharacterized protein YkwD